MENIVVKKDKYELATGEYSLDFSDCKSSKIVIDNEVNSNCKVLIKNISNVDELDVNIKKDSCFLLSLLLDQDINKVRIKINVEENSSLEGFIADFSYNVLDFDCTINLLKEGANAYIKLASLSANKDNKSISVSINHLVGKTYGKVDNYGVCKDFGKLLFAGTSHIFENASKCKTQQNAKIMVFDEESNAIAKPILKIDENDIEASHAAVVGKINDEHLFYLTSRGISEADAKQLITLGYLKPILMGFENEEARNYISSLIERRM